MRRHKCRAVVNVKKKKKKKTNVKCIARILIFIVYMPIDLEQMRRASFVSLLSEILAAAGSKPSSQFSFPSGRLFERAKTSSASD